MDSIMDFIRAQSKPEDYKLTEDEFQAVYDWINAHKDELPQPLKSGMLKLVNGEEHRNL